MKILRTDLPRIPNKGEVCFNCTVSSGTSLWYYFNCNTIAANYDRYVAHIFNEACVPSTTDKIDSFRKNKNTCTQFLLKSS